MIKIIKLHVGNIKFGHNYYIYIKIAYTYRKQSMRPQQYNYSNARTESKAGGCTIKTHLHRLYKINALLFRFELFKKIFFKDIIAF